MKINTWARDNEDLDLLMNSLNAQAGRFMYTDSGLRFILLRAQAAIAKLEIMYKLANNRGMTESEEESK